MNESFVAQLCQTPLGRAGGAGEILYWQTAIDRSTVNAAQVTQFFVESEEFQELVAPISKVGFRNAVEASVADRYWCGVTLWDRWASADCL